MFFLCRIALDLGKVLWRELSLLQELFDFSDPFKYPFLHQNLYLFLLNFVLHLNFKALLIILHTCDESRDFLIEFCLSLIKSSFYLFFVALYRYYLPFEFLDYEFVFLDHVITCHDYGCLFWKSLPEVHICLVTYLLKSGLTLFKLLIYLFKFLL